MPDPPGECCENMFDKFEYFQVVFFPSKGVYNNDQHSNNNNNNNKENKYKE